MRRLPHYLLNAHCLGMGRLRHPLAISLWEDSIAMCCSSLHLREDIPQWGDCS
jgi:hypothetical protein